MVEISVMQEPGQVGKQKMATEEERIDDHCGSDLGKPVS